MTDRVLARHPTKNWRATGKPTMYLDRASAAVEQLIQAVTCEPPLDDEELDAAAERALEALERRRGSTPADSFYARPGQKEAFERVVTRLGVKPGKESPMGILAKLKSRTITSVYDCPSDELAAYLEAHDVATEDVARAIAQVDEREAKARELLSEARTERLAKLQARADAEGQFVPGDPSDPRAEEFERPYATMRGWVESWGVRPVNGRLRSFTDEARARRQILRHELLSRGRGAA